MALLAIQGAQNTLTTAYKTAMSAVCPASNMRRMKIFDINMAAQSAPASTDTNIQFDLSRISAAGTSTPFTLLYLDPADTYSTTIGGVNHSVEITLVAAGTSVFNIAMNQRAPYRWQTYLGSGAEIMMPATASNGFAFRALSAGYTGAAGGTIYFMEH